MIIIVDRHEQKLNNDAKIIWSGKFAHNGDEVEGELHMSATHEGIILDFIPKGEQEPIATMSLDFDNLCALLK